MANQSETDLEATRETIGPILGRIPSGVFVLTAADSEGNETGMLASWVQQAAFDPPLLSVAVNKQRYMNEWLEQVPRLALNVVGSSQKQLLKHFGRGFAPGEPAFEGLSVSRGTTGLPLLNDALAYLEGNVVGQCDAGDHTLYLLEITGAGAGKSFPDEKPMVHIRKNGFSY